MMIQVKRLPRRLFIGNVTYLRYDGKFVENITINGGYFAKVFIKRKDRQS